MGIALCRRGDWERGLDHLRPMAEGDTSGDLPGVFYSYLGRGIAMKEGRVREGIRLCRHAVKVEFYQPENYINLAHVYLLANNRRRAWEAVVQGLQVDKGHKGLKRLAYQMGVRKRPVIPFLSRDNFLNRLLGRIRHDMKGSAKKKG